MAFSSQLILYTTSSSDSEKFIPIFQEAATDVKGQAPASGRDDSSSDIVGSRSGARGRRLGAASTSGSGGSGSGSGGSGSSTGGSGSGRVPGPSGSGTGDASSQVKGVVCQDVEPLAEVLQIAALEQKEKGLEEKQSSVEIREEAKDLQIRGSCWSQMIPEMLGSIARRLDRLRDIISFARVCRSWREIFWTNYTPSPQVPHRVFVDITHDRFLSYDPSTCDIFEVGYHIGGDFDGGLVIGSGCGWLVLLRRFPHEYVFLLSPIEGLSCELPALYLHDEDLFFMVEGAICDFDDDPIDAYGHDRGFVRKVVVVHESPEPADYAIIVLFDAKARLGCARPGDRYWSTIRVGFSHYQDVTVYGGQLYAIDCFGLVSIYDLATDTLRGVAVLSHSIFGDTRFSEVGSWHRLYLVATASELYVVARRFVNRTTTTFLLFRMDLEARTIERIYDIGDYVFFLGRMTSSMALCTRDILWPHARSAIWYADDCPYPLRPDLSFDVGLYDVEHGMLIVEPDFPREDVDVTMPSLWLHHHHIIGWPVGEELGSLLESTHIHIGALGLPCCCIKELKQDCKSLNLNPDFTLVHYPISRETVGRKWTCALHMATVVWPSPTVDGTQPPPAVDDTMPQFMSQPPPVSNNIPDTTFGQWETMHNQQYQ
ncbi:hypothetical protein LguiA_012799 [Lonicera macranthoides]